MEVKIVEGSTKFFRLSRIENGKEIARCWIYLIRNDLHEPPYALLEDVFVMKQYRRRGIWTSLYKEAMELAKNKGCYKMIATSRYRRLEVHAIYKKLGFEDWGKEFRFNFK